MADDIYKLLYLCGFKVVLSVWQIQVLFLKLPEICKIYFQAVVGLIYGCEVHRYGRQTVSKKKNQCSNRKNVDKNGQCICN